MSEIHCITKEIPMDKPNRNENTCPYINDHSSIIQSSQSGNNPNVHQLMNKQNLLQKQEHMLQIIAKRKKCH